MSGSQGGSGADEPLPSLGAIAPSGDPNYTEEKPPPEFFGHDIKAALELLGPHLKDGKHSVADMRALLQGLSQHKDNEQDRGERRQYAKRLFWLEVGWLAAMLIMVGAEGASCLPVLPDLAYEAVSDGATVQWNFSCRQFSLGEPIAIALITTTTINILALFVMVLHYLFKAESKPSAT